MTMFVANEICMQHKFHGTTIWVHTFKVYTYKQFPTFKSRTSDQIEAFFQQNVKMKYYIILGDMVGVVLLLLE